MIKIIKQGTRQITTCENCGCEFSYESDDILEKLKPMYNGFPKIDKMYVKCPQCKTEIEI